MKTSVISSFATGTVTYTGKQELTTDVFDKLPLKKKISYLKYLNRKFVKDDELNIMTDKQFIDEYKKYVDDVT